MRADVAQLLMADIYEKWVGIGKYSRHAEEEDIEINGTSDVKTEEEQGDRKEAWTGVVTEDHQGQETSHESDANAMEDVSRHLNGDELGNGDNKEHIKSEQALI